MLKPGQIYECIHAGTNAYLNGGPGGVLTIQITKIVPGIVSFVSNNYADHLIKGVFGTFDRSGLVYNVLYTDFKKTLAEGKYFKLDVIATANNMKELEQLNLDVEETENM